MAKLYLLGAMLILVAIGYQYREEIMTMVQTKLDSVQANIKKEDSSFKKQTPKQEVPEDDSAERQPQTQPEKTTQTEPETEADSKTESDKTKNYYNPPFDTENPPNPIISKSGTRLITLNELAAHGHSGPLKPIWLAVLGKVFDVDKGAEHYYGPSGGYNFFTGRDGTRAFVTGEFDDEGLIDDIEGLSPLQVGELEDWSKFYEKDYTYVGKLIARYYNKDGSPTKEWYKYNKLLGEKDKIKAEQRALEKKYPGCNSHWTEADGGKVYCGTKSGGVHRDWVGYPRRFFAPGTKSWRCACIHERDLGSPHVKLYPDCDPTSIECKVNPEKIKQLRETGQ